MGGNRALGVKLDNNTAFIDAEHGEVFRKRNCIAFTSTQPYKDVKPEEMDFIKDVMGVGAGERVLVAIGNPDNIENAFEEFTKSKYLQ
jgi:hypothetical protein